MQNTNLLGMPLVTLTLAVLLPVAASASTLDRVADAGQINMGYVADAAPFSSKGAGGEPEGYSIELCRRVADAVKARTGLQRLNVNFVATSVDAGLGQVANGTIDILCGSVTDTLKRRERVSFSLPIYGGGIGVILHKNAPRDLVNVLEGREANPGPKWRATINQGLAQHTYAVHEGTVSEDWVREKIAMLGVIATIVKAKTNDEGVTMVESGDADAYFTDRAILARFADEPQFADLMVLDRHFTLEAIALPVPRNDDDFRLVVDTALSDLYRSEEQFKALYTRSFGAPSEETLKLFELVARQP